VRAPPWCGWQWHNWSIPTAIVAIGLRVSTAFLQCGPAVDASGIPTFSHVRGEMRKVQVKGPQG
jgi:hypothetical protein